jgi:ABC-type transporter MlaC component
MHFSYWCLNAARVLAPYVFTVALALLVHPSAQAANSTAENMAQTFVQNSIDKGYAMLEDPTLSADERENRFRGLLPSPVDLKRIAAFAVGPYAHGASVVERDSFEKAFADVVITIYQRNLSARGDERIGSTPKDKDEPLRTTAAIRARAEISVF